MTHANASHLASHLCQRALLTSRPDLSGLIGAGRGHLGGQSGPLDGTHLDRPQRVALEALIAGMAAASGIAGGLDLAFTVFGEQIRQHNDAIRAKIQQVRNTSAARKVLSNRIAELRQVRSRIMSLNNDDDRPEAHRYFAGQIATDGLSRTEVRELLTIRRYEIDPRTGVTSEAKTGSRIGHHDDSRISADMVAERVKELENLAQELDSNREIGLIELNALISRKANLVELLSNVEKKKHESRRSVIGNLR